MSELSVIIIIYTVYIIFGFLIVFILDCIDVMEKIISPCESFADGLLLFLGWPFVLFKALHFTSLNFIRHITGFKHG